MQFCIKRNANTNLQVVAASATASRATRDALRKALRGDPYGRWSSNEVEVLRAADASQESARSVVVPSAARHKLAGMRAEWQQQLGARRSELGIPQAAEDADDAAAAVPNSSGKGPVALPKRRRIHRGGSSALRSDAAAEAEFEVSS